MEVWEDMSWFRRILLVILAAMVVGFGVATPIVGARKGMAYHDTLFYPREESGVLRYTGRLDREAAVFTVYPDRRVEYRWGEEVYGPYTVAEDPTAAPKDSYGIPGIEIRRGEEVLFRGGYVSGLDGGYTLFGEDGQMPSGMFSYTMNGKSYGHDGRELTPRELHEPSLSRITLLALDTPKLTHRGHLGYYLLITLLALFNIFQICYPGLMFYWSIRWDVKNPYLAEPSDYYVFMEQLEWVFLTIVAAVLYWIALTKII